MRLLAGCASLLLLAASHSHAADIVIGAIYPAGSDARQAVETALDIVNGTHAAMPVLMGRGGGLDRLGGAKLAVVFADDAASAEPLITGSHAVALIGGVSDEGVATISRVAEQHGLPFLSLDRPVQNGEGLTWFFRLGRTPARDARRELQLLGGIASDNGRSLQSVAVVADDSPAGHARSDALRTAADAAGVKLVAVADAADKAAQDSPVLMQRTGDGIPPEGVFRSVSYSGELLAARPGVPMVNAAFEARSGKLLDTATAREITGVLLLADVINRATSTRPIDLRTALMATDTPGGETLMLWDGVRFDDTGQNVLATPALQQVQGGAFQTVAPDSVANVAATWPATR